MRVAILCLTVLLGGCFAAQPRIIVLTPPAGFLEPCELPPVPEDNPGLSDAFVAAYRCAEIGNRDKERIAQWAKDTDRRLAR